MMLSMPIRSAALAAALTIWSLPATGADGVLALVAKASHACFSDRVRVAGFLVPQTEAIATVDSDGYKVTELLASEGDAVTSGQTLARLSRTNPQTGAATAAILRAPAAGVITRRATMVGIYASPQAEPMFRIMVDGKIDLEVEVPSMHLPKLKPGAPARVMVEGGPEINGRVRSVASEIDRRGQLGKVRLSLDNDPTLRVGMFARATIDASRSCGVAIPRSAPFNRTDGIVVQVVRDGKIETRPVKVGLSSDTHVEIKEGIREGEIVVANAGTSLRDGDTIKPIYAEEAEQGRGR